MRSEDNLEKDMIEAQVEIGKHPEKSEFEVEVTPCPKCGSDKKGWIPTSVPCFYCADCNHIWIPKILNDKGEKR